MLRWRRCWPSSSRASAPPDHAPLPRHAFQQGQNRLSHDDRRAGRRVVVQLSARGLGAGGGYYHLASEQLIRYRAAVDDDRTGGELVAIADELEALEIDVAGPDALKRSPRGYPADHPRAALLRQRGLIAWKQ